MVISVDDPCICSCQKSALSCVSCSFNCTFSSLTIVKSSNSVDLVRVSSFSVTWGRRNQSTKLLWKLPDTADLELRRWSSNYLFLQIIVRQA